MLSVDEVDYLVQATHSSVKRFGGDGPTLSHLAFVLSDKWGTPFTEVFGDSGPEHIRLLLKHKTFLGDESDVRTVLTANDDKAAVLAELHAKLMGPIADAVAAAAEPAEQTLPQEQTESSAEDQETGWPERTRRFLRTIEPRSDLLERDEHVIQLAGILARTRRRVPVVLGGQGSGRTSLLGALVGRLGADSNSESAQQVWRVGPDTLTEDPEGPLSRIIEDCESPTVLVLDDFDRMVSLGTSHPNHGVLRLTMTALSHPHLQLVLVCDRRYYKRLGIHAEALVDQLVPVNVEGLSEESVREVVQRALPGIESEHAVTISPGLRAHACSPARSTDVAVHPGLAIDRLDAAASRANAAGDPVAEAYHLAESASTVSSLTRAGDFADQLTRRVRGQPEAVRAVATRLALTLAKLDLRPERPDGVFLFVGPTGVGKTELARAISAGLFGSENRLIRLDMSEYSHDWAVSRLVGPMPGFVGSTEPETWLTTRVAQMPECVVLLDEIEKAHPVVWNTFLQVFDAGRLTDSRGTTADFSSTIIVMTSNLGAAAASAPALGFGNGQADANRARDKIIGVVKERMAPELINRIDELVVFDALGREAIEEIAESELNRVCLRLAEAGWELSYDSGVVEHLAATGYDSAYGARHLQRNIERLFLTLIAGADSKTLTVGVRDGELVAAGRPREVPLNS